MMRALVAGSAWIWPPVDGPAEPVTGAVAALELPGLVVLLATACGVAHGGGTAGTLRRHPLSPAIAARSVVASETASAFFR